MSGYESTPVIELVDIIVATAIEKSASDIHFESTQQGLRVRFRVDGVLYDQDMIVAKVGPQVLARIKILASLDSAQKRIPQDGKFHVTHNDVDVDLRISTFPALYGEKIVVRILDRSKNTLALNNLGFSEQTLQSFTSLTHQSSGFFLVTGPTGSGKTTTLYATLAELNAPEQHIITLEDPVEYNLAGVTQGQINPQTGFTFEKGIRSLLRQDPDIVMIGEIRDTQTARIAIEAALTGHVVFSTLHTHDAPSAIMRLMDMGIEPFLINAALSGVLAQRLARTICVHCKIEYKPDEQEQVLLNELNVSHKVLYKATGCTKCSQLGYKGRTGIFELLTMTSSLRALVVQHPLFDNVYEQACADGMQTLLHDGIQKVCEGIITLQELVRVLL